MIIAFLFNSDHQKYGFSYGVPIRQTIFSSGMIQASQRHMKVSVGDVLIHSHARTQERYFELTEAVYLSDLWHLYPEDRLFETFGTATVYAVVFENMTKNLAKGLHDILLADESYLGLMQVEYDYGPHLALMRNSMVMLYRIEGSTCRVFYSMGEEDARDDYEIEAMKELGFSDVDWEDRGAHGTIFDDFDTLEHFQRVAAFRAAVTPFLSGGEDEAYELVMVLQDLNPRLFNALGAAVRALKQAQTEEDVAQSAISGRRYLEKFADVLFPARKDLFNGRKVGANEYKNRIWAYIEENTTTREQLLGLGKEIDRLSEEFNAGLHSDIEPSRVLKALVDLARITALLLSLDPRGARKPYFAHQKNIHEFFKGIVGDHKGSERSE